MKKYVVWSIYTMTGSHIQDRVEARSVEEALTKADKLPNRLSYEAVQIDEYENQTLPKGGRNSSINIHEYNPN